MKKFNFMLLMLMGITLMGCYPQYDPVYTEDLDLVLTNYYDKFDFGTTKTYTLPDRVPKVSGSEIKDTSEIEYANPAIASTILSSIRRNLNAIGWQEVDSSAKPDVIILPTTSQTTNVYYTYYSGYWGGYPGYGYGYGYGWYYPMYYPPVATSYKTGSLLIQMNNRNYSGEGRQIVWTTLINGLLEGSNAEIQVRVSNTIDQAFKQSPYLKK